MPERSTDTEQTRGEAAVNAPSPRRSRSPHGDPAGHAARHGRLLHAPAVSPASPARQHLSLDQGTHAWHQHRHLHRNASEAGCIMNVSPFDPDTWAKLWAIKTGRARKRPATAAMTRGLKLEKEALACYELITGEVMVPHVFTKGDYSASLDGINLTGDIDLEMKCPAKGQDSLLWQQAEAGEVPAHYYWQIQHQLYVSEARLAHFFVYDGEGGALLLEVAPNEDDITRLLGEWDRFWVYIDEDIEPPLTEKEMARRARQSSVLRR